MNHLSFKVRFLAWVVMFALVIVGEQACSDDASGGFTVQESHESDLGGGWIGAGQPSEDRLRDLVAAGARIISIRPAAEDPFDEEAVVTNAGGTFVRFPVESSRYDDVAFRTSLYDFLDAQMAVEGKVYFHCKSSNRVGAAWALYHAERKDVDAQQALEMGRAAGLSSLEPTVKGILGL